MVLENPQLGVKNVAFLTPNTRQNCFEIQNMHNPPFMISSSLLVKKRAKSI
ncbi:hypothetical protein SAMN05216463_10749 [Xylanibacter ruminicola]|jgi:hypothetical protein|uniref:Uncharacterized protein n=1 Tax=Xylanibacter ruminicola TaxID=839 RepID=A0A1M6TW99_XYLRU|nr:hypothetical protein SAMN05216463_10749 [Xylanibacter ruminicola]